MIKPNLNDIHMQPHIITIDGPSASGKGTIATNISQKLNFNYLDSGAIYRLTAYIACHNLEEIEELHEADLYTENICIKIMQAFMHADIEFKTTMTKTSIILNGQDVSATLRQENIGKQASILASIPYIRQHLLNWQRQFAIIKIKGKYGLVTDGRDMGTVVFPHAMCKIFLIADVNQRARRRYTQLQSQLQIKNNINNQSILSYSQILQDLQERDNRDMQRTHSPLKPAADAHIIDNTLLSITETVDVILGLYQSKVSI